MNQERLEQLRQSLQSETISYGELAELQSLVEFIDPSDVELLEAAGVPEKLNDDDSFTEASQQAIELLDQAAPLVAKALEVLMKAFGVGDAYAIERDIDYPPEKWRAATILVNARAAHMHVTDYLGS